MVRLLDRFQNVSNVADIPCITTYIILSRSTSWIGKSIQGVQRLWQYLRGDRDTDHIPNHADIVRFMRAIGALEKGVKMNPVANHFKHPADYFIIRIKADDTELMKIWHFALNQVGARYAYLDLVKHFVNTITGKWEGKQPKRVKWTCYWLMGEAVNKGLNRVIFPNPRSLSPYEFCEIIDERKDIFY